MASSHYSILLIEDNELEQEFFQHLIDSEDLPYELIISSSVEEAKQILTEREHRLDAVLADYRLGDGSAFDVMDHLDESSNLPFILITAWGDLRVAIQAVRAGAVDFIEKDVDGHFWKAIPKVIDRVVQLKRAKDQFKMLHELHKTVLANSFDAFAIIDPNGDLIYANELLINLSHYLKEELLNIGLSDLMIGNSRFVGTIIRSCKKNQKIINLETTLLPKTGPVIPVALSASQIKNQENILICMRDLRLESELGEEVRLFRKFFTNHIHASFFVWGNRGPEPLMSEELPFAKKADELLMKMAIYYFTALGQGGQTRTTGLFGPLPTPDVPGYVSLVYSFSIDDPSNLDSRDEGRSYCFFAFLMPEAIAPIFGNRTLLGNKLAKKLEEITTLSEISLPFLISLKYELLGLQQEEPILVRILNDKGLTIYSREFLMEDSSDKSINGLVTTISKFIQVSSLSMFESLRQIKHKDHVIFIKANNPFLFFYICKSRSYDEQRKLEEFIEAVQGEATIQEALVTNNQDLPEAVRKSLDKIAEELFLPLTV